MGRTKVVEFDGATFTIGALSIRQAEQFIAKQREALGHDEHDAPKPGVQASPEKLAANWREFICTGLNNAQQNAADSWTPEKLADAIDLISLNRLRNELLEFSGLTSSPAGEAPATAIAPERAKPFAVPASTAS